MICTLLTGLSSKECTHHCPNYGVHFIMSKLTREQKIEVYNRRKSGETISSLTQKLNIKMKAVNRLVSHIYFHGFDILRTDKNNYYSILMK